VDLNRDWEVGWSKEAEMAEQTPGSRPFSQPETRILKKELDSFKPDFFMTVHSGKVRTGTYLHMSA
jgi:hypothetical protein